MVEVLSMSNHFCKLIYPLPPDDFIPDDIFQKILGVRQSYIIIIIIIIITVVITDHDSKPASLWDSGAYH